MATSTSSIGGLVSGLDTKTLISQLIAVAAQPQTQLKTQLVMTNAQNTAAQSINSKAASMTSLAKDLADTKTFTTSTVKSSDASVSVAASGSASVGSVSFSVTQVASAYSTATAYLSPVTYQADGTTPQPVSFSITPQGGSAVPITAASGSAKDLADAINASSAGVTATAVTDRDGSRLVLTAKTPGSTSAFTDTLSTTGQESVLRPAQDASIDLGNGVSFTSSTNTFKNLLDGVDVTVSAVSGNDGTTGLPKQVTVSSAVSSSSISSRVTSLVAGMNTVLSDVAFHTKSLATGTTASATNGGLLSGQSTFRDLAGSILDTISASTGTDAAVKAGLSVNRDGTVAFDSSKLEALLQSDPATAQKVLTAFATAVQSVGKSASDPTSGAVTGFITGTKTTVTSLTDRIADWDVRLDAKEARLTAQYAALETALQKLKSQGDALTQALAGLTSNNS